jgi:hypothetical protein
MSTDWLHELSGLITAAQGAFPGIRSEIRVRCGDQVSGIELGTGRISAGEKAASEICADKASLESLVRGELSLQSAFRTGKVALTGDPEPFLQLAMILDRQHSTGLVTC